MTACCEHHDRLDQTLHAEEYLGMTCGSLKQVCKKEPGGAMQATTQVKPAYCCDDCPTLIEAHRK